MEIDLSKPLLSKFWLEGKIWRIQCEGIRTVCFNCGKTGHAEEGCPLLNVDKNLDTQSALASINDHLRSTSIGTKEQGMDQHTTRPEEHEDFGSWMLVKNPVQKENASTGETTTDSRRWYYDTSYDCWQEYC